MFGYVIGTGNSVSHDKEKIRVTSKYVTGFKPNYTKGVSRETTAEWRQIHVALKAPEF